MTVQTKVYLEIVQKIRAIIDEDHLKAGDRLPSERELSARLSVGRSSVREALRSLELVGLIETRRGEGTFIKNIYEHSLVNVLATFLLQDEKTKNDLHQVKQLIEQDVLRILCSFDSHIECNDILLQNDLSIKAFHDVFWRKMTEKTNNYLLYRIWVILQAYDSTMTYELQLENRRLYHHICQAVEDKNETKALHYYNQLASCIMYS
ncbi:FadR/GntR family transcriptional regulator [Ectobacillus sp. sgz5001026]|uniref:FadR/GntR family transcriptional regulator n=1 Tax=Ectobacillus sp. sgz5001026 TaxID=3242473 RepID=UPI0036D38452